jgi:hypothetical protein
LFCQKYCVRWANLIFLFCQKYCVRWANLIFLFCQEYCVRWANLIFLFLPKTQVCLCFNFLLKYNSYLVVIDENYQLLWDYCLYTLDRTKIYVLIMSIYTGFQDSYFCWVYYINFCELHSTCVVGGPSVWNWFTSTYAERTYSLCSEFDSSQLECLHDTTRLDYKVCQWLVVGWWFFRCIPVPSVYKTTR